MRRATKATENHMAKRMVRCAECNMFKNMQVRVLNCQYKGFHGCFRTSADVPSRRVSAVICRHDRAKRCCGLRPPRQVLGGSQAAICVKGLQRLVWADRCDQPVVGATGSAPERLDIGRTVPGHETWDVRLPMQPCYHAASPSECITASAWQTPYQYPKNKGVGQFGSP